MLSKIFNKYSLKMKILAMVMPLMFWLSIFSFHTLVDLQTQMKQLNGIANVADTYDYFGKVIHLLQNERGLSTMFLNKKISLDELQKNREETDKFFPEVKRMISILPFTADTVKEITDKLDSISAIRKKVDNFEVTPQEMQAVYTQVIHTLINEESSAALFFQGKKLEMSLIGLAASEDLKETIGQTRAIYTAIFGKNTAISAIEAIKAESLHTQITSTLNSISLDLAPALQNKIRQILSSNEWNEINNALKTVAIKSTTGDYGVDPKDFFKKISDLINQLNDSLITERTSINTMAMHEFSSARLFFYGTLLFVLMTITGIGLFCWFIIQDLVSKEASDLIASEAAFKSASMVDNSPVATMMCDPSGIITYMNQSSLLTLQKLQQYLPEKFDHMIGKSIDMFHKNPAMQRKLISDPRNLPHKATIALGPEKLDLLVTASIDHSGKFLGVALSWSIVTAKVDLIRDLGKSADDLANAASNVMNISSTLSAAAEETSAQVNTASVASEEVNAGVQNVACNMEEMVSAIREITKTTNEAASMTSQAMELSNNANKIINKLGDSSMDIGNVIKVISSIAQQTNLLALNATIEAARAGEAGKGFAVVANEVKELANQTAKATSEITKKIETIQNDSKNAISAITDISSAIEKVNGYTASIAASVEEQAATTNEVTRIVTESAEGVKQISENMSQVSLAANNTGRDASKVQAASNGVGEIADLLKKYVARLKTE